MRSRACTYVRYAFLPFVFVAPPVLAGDDTFYVGASIADASRSGYSNLNIDTSDLGRVLEGSAFKIVGGLQPFRPLAFELSYVDFGVRRLQTFGPAGGLPALIPPAGTIDSHAVSISAVGLFPIHSVDLFGRIGLARWQTSTSNVLPVAANRRSEGTDRSYGIGAQVNLSKVSLRVEYEQFKIASDIAKLLSFGFTYHFR